METAPPWRDLLKKHIEDPTERLRIANALQVNPITLERWASGGTKPRLQNLRPLLTIFPDYRAELLAQFSEEFGVSFDGTDMNEEIPYEIPSAFYASILSAYSDKADAIRAWSIGDLILQQALKQLDPGRVGMELAIVQCTPPKATIVRSLREVTGQATSSLSKGGPHWPLFLGSESMAGWVVTAATSLTLRNRKEFLVRFPAHWVEGEMSASAAPILRAGRVAGCLLASSVEEQYFTPSRCVLLQKYASLLMLAFEREEFYAVENIRLLPMPPYEAQKRFIATFAQKLSLVMKEASNRQESLNIIQAERRAWQQIEEELLQYISSQSQSG